MSGPELYLHHHLGVGSQPCRAAQCIFTESRCNHLEDGSKDRRDRGSMHMCDVLAPKAQPHVLAWHAFHLRGERSLRKRSVTEVNIRIHVLFIARCGCPPARSWVAMSPESALEILSLDVTSSRPQAFWRRRLLAALKKPTAREAVFRGPAWLAIFCIDRSSILKHIGFHSQPKLDLGQPCIGMRSPITIRGRGQHAVGSNTYRTAPIMHPRTFTPVSQRCGGLTCVRLQAGGHISGIMESLLNNC